jgi:hypothetical protein
LTLLCIGYLIQTFQFSVFPSSPVPPIAHRAIREAGSLSCVNKQMGNPQLTTYSEERDAHVFL